MDAGYLKTEVGLPLRQCLTEVAEKRPYDPIEFIAHWLYKHVENKKHEEQKKSDAAQLIREQEEYELELIRREKMRQEAERLAAIEAEKRRAEEELRAREAASASKLATVAESDEPNAEPKEEGAEKTGEEGEGGEKPAEGEEGEAPPAADEEAPAEGEATEEA